MKEWQRGIELAVLKRHADLFRARHKPLVFGAFGLTKERDIAAALAEQRLVWTGHTTDSGSPRSSGIGACAITHRLKAGSTHRDFCGRELKLRAGDVNVSSFACLTPELGARVLAAINERAGDCVFVEAFEEDATAREALDAAGFTYCMTKITAGSENKGMYSSSPRSALPELPRSESAALEVCRPGFASPEEVAQALAEVRAFEAAGPMWAQHYSSYNKRQSWTAIALRGYDPADPSFIIAPREMSQGWKAENPERLKAACDWTKAAEHFPTALALVDRVPGAKDRVRFMRLAAAGELTRHADITDRLAGTADGRLTRVHIPLVTNDGVRFVGWGLRGERIERWLPPGALCFLDQRKAHAVVNRSAAERIHIVADVESSPALRELLFGQEAHRGN